MGSKRRKERRWKRNVKDIGRMRKNEWIGGKKKEL